MTELRIKIIPIAGLLVDGFEVEDIGEKEMSRRLGYDRMYEPQPTLDQRVIVGQEILHKGEPVKVKADQGAHVLVEGSKGEFLLPKERAVMGAPSTAGWRPPKPSDTGVIKMLGPDQIRHSHLNQQIVTDIRNALPHYDEIHLVSSDILDQDYEQRVRWLLMKERVPMSKIRFRLRRWDPSDRKPF